MLKKTEGFVRLSSPGEEVYIDVWLLKNDDDSSHVHSIDDIIAEMNEWCNDVHYTRDESADYNQDGIQMLGYSGIGTLKNSSAASHGKQNFYGHAFSPTAKSRFMVVTIRDETAPADTWQETIKDIIKSIQVVNP